jgi:malate synthase
MADQANPTGHAFAAALNLVVKGTIEPSGYTEPGLHAARLKQKDGV